MGRRHQQPDCTLTCTRVSVLQEVEEYEEFDEAELVDDEDEDPDFTPGIYILMNILCVSSP